MTRIPGARPVYRSAVWVSALATFTTVLVFGFVGRAVEANGAQAHPFIILGGY